MPPIQSPYNIESQPDKGELGELFGAQVAGRGEGFPYFSLHSLRQQEEYFNYSFILIIKVLSYILVKPISGRCLLKMKLTSQVLTHYSSL